LVQLGGRVIGNAPQCVGKPSLWIDAVEFCRSDQGVHRGSALTSPIGAGEQPCAAPESNRPVILPISGRRSRSIVAGTHIMDDAFVANMSSGAPAVMSFTSR
jgi:hypothetical protein